MFGVRWDGQNSFMSCPNSRGKLRFCSALLCPILSSPCHGRKKGRWWSGRVGLKRWKTLNLVWSLRPKSTTTKAKWLDIHNLKLYQLIIYFPFHISYFEFEYHINIYN